MKKRYTWQCLLSLSICFISNTDTAFSQNTNFQSGAFVVDMGIRPQTAANALKPYGMVYDLVRNYDVPVYWSINPHKQKDGADLILNGIEYKGGPFIIAAEHRTTTVNSRIAYWQSQGVMGITANSAFSAPVAHIINAAPRWTMDLKSGQIAQGYLQNAGIPTQNANWSEPYMLNSCNDLFVMPHADPTWDYHKFLIDWNNNSKGALWVSCHAVSVLENMFNPANPSQQANFLAMNSAGPGSQALVPFTSHKDGGAPFNNNNFPANPVMQFMGSVDNATNNGSEQLYLPANGGGWRSGTQVAVFDPSHANVPSLSPGKAAVIAYGKAYGDDNRGWVMYQGGHSHEKGGESAIAAQRAFLNFSFMATFQKSIQLTVTGIPLTMISNTSYNLSASIQQAVSAAPYTFQWSSSIGGTFSNAGNLNTSFTPPAVGSPVNCVLRLKVTDACNRTSFQTFNVQVTSGPRPPVANTDSLYFDPQCINFNPAININALENDHEPDGQPMTITSVTGANGSWSVNPDQTIRFIPNTGFYGTASASYTVCDNTVPTAQCSTGTIKITIGTAGQQPAVADDTYSILEDSVQLRLNVLANDQPGLGGGPLRIGGLQSHPLHGKVSINPDNTITYLPNADNRVADSFFYKASNAAGYVSVGKVKINIIADGCSPGQYQTCIPGPNPISVIASEDTYLNDKSGNRDINFGNSQHIIVDRENTDKHRTLIRFTLPSLTCNPEITATITGATLRLYKITGGGGDLDIDVYRVTSDWNQNQATWNSRLTSTTWTTPGGDFNTTSFDRKTVNADGLYSWNVTSLVTGWYNSTFPNQGMLLKTTEGGGNRDPHFVSSESSSIHPKPTLEISYTLPNLCRVIPVRAPLSMPDTASTDALTAVTIPVLNNDFFPNAGTRTVSIIPGSVSAGSAVVSGTDVVYTPSSSFSGIASLQYRVQNNSTNLSDTATVFIFVKHATPKANNDSSTVLTGSSVSVNVTSNDIDYHGTGLSVAIINSPKYGRATQAGNTITYQAPFNFIGRDSIRYRLTNSAASLCNGSVTADTAFFIITVLNRPPVAVNDTVTTNPCQSVAIDALRNDTDPEKGSMFIASIGSVSPASAGTATYDGNLIYFSPNSSYLGTSATISYNIRDDASPAAISNNATVLINFSNLTNRAPIAVNDTVAGICDNDNYINVLLNDSDPDQDPLTVSLGPSLLQPSHGTVTLLPNGLIKYTPNSNFFGSDVFEYRIADSRLGIVNGACASVSLSSVARVFITLHSRFIALSGDHLQLQLTRSGQDNLLKWSYNEKNEPISYTIQRSTDNQHYSDIKTVQQHQAANGIRYYNWTDFSVNGKTTWYRIKVTTSSGEERYSNVAELTRQDMLSLIRIMPVPFNSHLTAEINSESTEPIQVVLVSKTGAIVRKSSFLPKTGINQIILQDLDNLPPGTYYFRSIQNKNVLMQQAIKVY